MALPFIDLQAQQRVIADAVQQAIGRVLAHGAYIMGPEVTELEQQLARFCGSKHVLSCSNGTDALALVLRGWGIGPGDAVLVPAFTFAATAEVVAWLGATPVFVDVGEHDFNMDAESLRDGIATARRLGLTPRAVIPVDLFGQPADYDALLPIAAEAGLKVLCDAAQACGATYRSRRVGEIGDATSTSFFPAKPLGCYGDGGAVFTDDANLIEAMRSLRVHGQGADKYENVRIGINGRLDTIQAAVLLQKLVIFPSEIAARERIAVRYNAGLSNAVSVPRVAEGRTSVWAQYTIRVPAATRRRVISDLKEKGIPTAVYYPIPLNRQPAYAAYPSASGGVPVSERLASEVLSLPMHPYLAAETQDFIVGEVRRALAG